MVYYNMAESIKFPIIIKDTRGGEDVIEVYPEYTATQLITIVSQKKGLDDTKIKFIYSGKNIEPNQKLSDLNITKRSVIYMTMSIK
jgi:hypothetical protein